MSLYQTCSLTKITLLWVTFSQTVPLLLSGNICPPLHSSISLSCHLFLHPFVHSSISSTPSFPPSYREVCHSTSLVCSSGSQLMCSPPRMTPQKVGIILPSSLSLSKPSDFIHLPTTLFTLYCSSSETTPSPLSPSFPGTSDIPHFSSVPLADQFALTEHLTYFYFLQRGQPSFAFANFVAAKLIGHSNTTKRQVVYVFPQ